MSNKNLSQSSQYLFFTIDNETYALSTSYIKEIIDYTKITKVPNVHKALKGVINVRGELLALVDPKIRFGESESKIDKKTSFLIIQFSKDVTSDDSKDKKQLNVAVLVDTVIEVEDILKESILEVPQFGMKIDRRFIKNLIKKQNEHICVLDIENLLDVKELSKAL